MVEGDAIDGDEHVSVWKAKRPRDVKNVFDGERMRRKVM